MSYCLDMCVAIYASLQAAAADRAVVHHASSHNKDLALPGFPDVYCTL